MSTSSAGLARSRPLKPGLLKRIRAQSTRVLGLELVLLLLLAVLLRGFSWQVSAIGMEPDEAVYLVIAQQWLAGHLPYVVAWDQHPVGLPALLAAGGWLLGDVLLAARVAATLAVGLTGWLILRLVVDFLGDRRAGLAASVLYLLFTTRMEALPAQTEIFNNALVAAAAWLLMGARLQRMPADLRRVAAAGLLLGCGLQIKYVVLPECAALGCLYLGWRRAGGAAWRPLAVRAAVMMAGGLAPTLLAAVVYWRAGLFAAFWHANVDANLAYAMATPSAGEAAELIWVGLRRCGPLLAVALPALLLCLRRGSARERAMAVLLACWLVAVAIDILLPMKFWTHYFLALVPPLCVACAMAFSRLARAGRPVLAVAAMLAVMALPLRTAWDNTLLVRRIGQLDAPRLIAADIARLGPGGLYVYNDNPVLYYLAGAVPATRFILPVELSDFTVSSGRAARDEVAAVLAGQPRYIVTSDPPRYGFPPEVDAMMAAALQGYAMVARYPSLAAGGHLQLFRRASPGEAAPVSPAGASPAAGRS